MPAPQGSGAAEFGVRESADGIEIRGISTAPDTLDPQDLQAYGFTWQNLSSGDLPETSTALITGLDPATQSANGWAPPQLTITDLGDGLTERRLTLGSGAELASVRDDDRRVLRVIYQRDDTDSTGDPRRIITTENRHADGSVNGPIEDLSLRQTDSGDWLPQSRTWRSTGTDPDSGERSTTETRTTNESTCVRRKRQGGGCTQSAFHGKERPFYCGYGNETRISRSKQLVAAKSVSEEPSATEP